MTNRQAILFCAWFTIVWFALLATVALLIEALP